ncbi:MAG: ABC transporter substrate-binding protein [Candidatus Omnitrophota bacterium]
MGNSIVLNIFGSNYLISGNYLKTEPANGDDVQHKGFSDIQGLCLRILKRQVIISHEVTMVLLKINNLRKKSVRLFIFSLCFLLSMINPLAAAEVDIPVFIDRELNAYQSIVEGIGEILKKNRYTPNFTYYNFEDSTPQGQAMARKIKDKKSDLILTLGSKASIIVKNEISDIPVVFSLVINPLEEGLVNSMTRPGNNVTGVSINISVETQFTVIKSIIPTARRIGVVYDRDKTAGVVKEAKEAAEKLGLELVALPVSSKADVPKTIESLNGKIDVLWGTVDTTVFTSQSIQFILLFSLRNKIPFIGFSPSFVKAGALMGVYCNYKNIGRKTGEMIIRVLKGEAPGDIPVDLPTDPDLAINVRVADIMGIKIPAKVLSKADEIFK